MKSTTVNFQLVAAAILIALVLIIRGSIAYGTDEHMTFTVTDKERIVNNTSEGSSSKYLVFTDKGTFENTDSLFYWKFNSSDLYGRLKKGATYMAHVYGFRVGFLSWYKNIVSVNEIRPIAQVQD